MLARTLQTLGAGLVAAAALACFGSGDGPGAGTGGTAGVGAASAQGACSQWEVMLVEPQGCASTGCPMPAGWEPFAVGSSVDYYVRRCAQ